MLTCTTPRTCRHSTSSGLRWGPLAPTGGTARGRISGPVRGRRPGGVVGGLLGLILPAPTIRHGRAPVVVEEPVCVERRMSIDAVDYRGCAAMRYRCLAAAGMQGGRKGVIAYRLRHPN